MRKQVAPSSGFTLIEILLVVGILAILAIAAFVIFPQVQAASRAQVERDHLTAVAANIKRLYLGTSYGGLNNDIANIARVFPTRMNNNNYAAGQAIVSIWGGDVTVAPAPGPAPKTFTITYQAIPASICVKLVTSIVPSFEKITVNAVVIKTILDSVQVGARPDAIVQACGTSDANDMTIETY